MNEKEKKDLTLKSDADLTIVPEKYQQLYSLYRDEIDCFLRAYVLLRGVPGITMERDTAGGNYGRYFFPTSEHNVLQVMNAIRERIKPGREPFTYSDLRDMVSDTPFCETSENPMIYMSEKENRYPVSRENTDSSIPLKADNRILAVRGFDLSPIEKIVAKESEPIEEVPGPQLTTVSDYFAFDAGIKRAKQLSDRGGLRFNLFWSEPTYIEAGGYCNTHIPSLKGSATSSLFSSTLQKNLLTNSSLSEYLSDLDRAGFPVYPVVQLLLNTGENKNPCLKGYLVHRSIADKIRAAVNPNIATIILSSQGHPKIRDQVNKLTVELQFINDIQNTTLDRSIPESRYTCKDLIGELLGEGVVTRTRSGNMRLNERYPDSGYLYEKKDEILSRMSELFQNFFELPLSEISEMGYLPEGQGPSGYLPE